MKIKLTLLLLVSTFIFGCAKPNPHLGKWVGDYEGQTVILEILEDGNCISKLLNSDGTIDEAFSSKWSATDEGIVFENNMTAYIHEDSLITTRNDKTVIYERVVERVE